MHRVAGDDGTAVRAAAGVAGQPFCRDVLRGQAQPFAEQPADGDVRDQVGVPVLGAAEGCGACALGLVQDVRGRSRVGRVCGDPQEADLRA
ncbi:hypothetical protein N566_27095 [Streptomycetaceae bacterium MP113-05]|nr:hypothetical protein N566_27095 [Streptomycetaceae bacterium MP113-05]